MLPNTETALICHILQCIKTLCKGQLSPVVRGLAVEDSYVHQSSAILMCTYRIEHLNAFECVRNRLENICVSSVIVQAIY